MYLFSMSIVSDIAAWSNVSSALLNVQIDLCNCSKYSMLKKISAYMTQVSLCPTSQETSKPGVDLSPSKSFLKYASRSEEHTSELQSRPHLVCRLLLEKKKNKKK